MTSCWRPPRYHSPLIQELYWPDEWKILICCLLLNLTTRRQVDQVVEKLFSTFPDAKSMSTADELKLRDIIRSLGMVNKRVKTLKRFSEEYLQGNWTTPKELYGCGKYADDAWHIFCHGDWRDVQPSDHALNAYHRFLQEKLG